MREVVPGMSKIREPSEASPLLGGPPLLINYLEAGDAPNGPLPSNVQAQGHALGNSRLGEGEDESEHGQQETSAEPNHYDGMPEVKKQLKWIFPAISLGVSISSTHDIRLVKVWRCFRYSCLLVIKQSLRQVMELSVVT